MIQKTENHITELCALSVKQRNDNEPLPQFSVRLIDSVGALENLIGEWNILLDESIHRNLFYDADYLVPAIKHFGEKQVKVLVVEAPRKSNPNGTPVLCGLVPIRQTRIYGMPLKTSQFWQHNHCYDCTPLLRHDCAEQVFRLIVQYLTDSEQNRLLSLEYVSNNSQFANLLTNFISENNRGCFFRDTFTRAAFKSECDLKTYQQLHISKNTRKKTNRLWRNLAKKGHVETIHISAAEDSERAIQSFLKLEMSGWKGKSGSALACNANEEAFFTEMVTRSMQNGKLSFFGLSLDGRPISLLCDLSSKAVSYAYKTAYDNQYSEFSPGFLAEFHNIENMYDCGVSLSDSCTASDNQTINRLWNSTIRFQHIVVPLRGGIASLATSLMPLIQQTGRIFHRR